MKPSAKTPVSCYLSWPTLRNGVVIHVGNPHSRGGKRKYEFMTLKDIQSSIFFFTLAGRKRTRNIFLPVSPRIKRNTVRKGKRLRLGFTVHNDVHGAKINSHYQ